MVVFPPCKINLGLRVLRKRTDGYHDIESLFYHVPLNDVLEAIPDSENNQGLSLEVSGLPVPTENNILNSIWNRLSEIRTIPATRVFLHKVIPFGAGLGGGSSDAAWFLRMLNQLYDLQLNAEELHHVALMAGSDCPFFLHDQPCLVSGRGEILQPIHFSLKGKYLLLVFPDIHISTAEAYRNIILSEEKAGISEILQMPLNEWKNHLFNDFENSVFPKYHALQNIKEQLYASGALYASMSGSGSTIYGIFDHSPVLQNKFPHSFLSKL